MAEEGKMAAEQRSADFGPVGLTGPNPPTVVGDIMTAPVISVAPDTPVRVIAQLLLENGISAVPVIEGTDDLVGMVSDGDLLGRSEQDRLARRKWWLAVVAAGEEPTIDNSARDFVRPAKEVMHAPVITIGADAPIQQAAEMLRSHQVKRLPVIRDGKMVGIVSRADLLRIVAATPPITSKPARRAGGLVGLITSLIGGDKGAAADDVSRLMPAMAASESQGPTTAQAFRQLVEKSKRTGEDEKRRTANEEELQRHRQVKSMLEAHLDAELWETLLAHARTAAAHGQKEFQLLRFPSDLCSDGGRKIDVAEPGWETTLRGEAADLYDRWERELKPAGFGLSARIIEYPSGKPGDIGLFLTWSE